MRRMNNEWPTPIHSFVSFLAGFLCYRRVDTLFSNTNPNLPTIVFEPLQYFWNLSLSDYACFLACWLASPPSRWNTINSIPEYTQLNNKAAKPNVWTHYVAMNRNTSRSSSSRTYRAQGHKSRTPPPLPLPAQTNSLIPVSSQETEVHLNRPSPLFYGNPQY